MADVKKNLVVSLISYAAQQDIPADGLSLRDRPGGFIKQVSFMPGYNDPGAFGVSSSHNHSYAHQDLYTSSFAVPFFQCPDAIGQSHLPRVVRGPGNGCLRS
jgi:hypothetical protein